MSTITAADVNKLRKMTGAGMMDCKKALTEAEGDFDKAIEYLRKQGQKVAAKRADREASEGAVLAGTNSNQTKGYIVSLNCETDFVAKNEGYVSLANRFLDIAIQHDVNSLEEFLSLPFESGLSVSDKLVEQTGVIGEKIEISAFEVLSAPFVAFYIHSGNKLATLVGLSAKAEEAGKNVAMQAAAMNPVALNKDEVSQEIIEREIEIAKELARNEGKPEDMLEKIAIGRLSKFFKENTLEEQEFIKDNKLSVNKYLETVEKGLKLTGFRRIGLGI